MIFDSGNVLSSSQGGSDDQKTSSIRLREAIKLK